jgi:hypothetical protein
MKIQEQGELQIYNFLMIISNGLRYSICMVVGELGPMTNQRLKLARGWTVLHNIMVIQNRNYSCEFQKEMSHHSKKSL